MIFSLEMDADISFLKCKKVDGLIERRTKTLTGCGLGTAIV